MNGSTFSGLVTLVLMLAFIGGWIWAWSSKRKPDFEAASRLPLDEDSPFASAPTASATDTRGNKP
ncbi:MAG: cbb3-type cytochrome c oxidase subunit 3 [Lysobacteraceae bacterium]